MVSAEFLSVGSSNTFRLLVKLGADLNADVGYFENAPFMCVLARLGYKHLLAVLVTEFGYEFQSDKVYVCFLCIVFC